MNNSNNNNNNNGEATTADPYPEQEDEEEEQEEQQQQEEQEEDPLTFLPSLQIPLHSSSSSSKDNNKDNNKDNSFIEIFPHELNEISVTTLLQVLRDEQAPLAVWAAAGHLLVRQHCTRQALQVLTEACEQATTSSTSTSTSTSTTTTNTSSTRAATKQEKVQCLAAAGIATLLAGGGNRGSHTTTTTTSNNTTNNSNNNNNNNNQDWTAADQKFTQAGKVDTFFPMTWIGRGLLNWQRGSTEQAKFFFQTTKKQCGAVLPALLGMAACYTAEHDDKAALQEYCTAIRQFPVSSGAVARVGLATAAYRLGQVDRAKAALQRARAMDPEYVPALVGTALLDMRACLAETHADFAQRMEVAIKLLSVANLLDGHNAMVQNHLANHYFWKWTPVTGTVNVTQGSKLVTSTQNLPLDPGERIRIGTQFETTVVADTNDDDDDDENDDDTTKFTIAQAWTAASAQGLKLWKKDYDRVVALAKGAYNATAVDAVKAESLFFLARVYHVRGEVEHAHKFYHKACALAKDSNLGPARFGLAQTCLAQQDYTGAAQNLSKVLQQSANATDALGLLGLVQARKPTTLEEGLGHLRKAMDLDPLNPEWLLWEAQALQQYEAHYPKALERYQKAIELLQRRKQKVSHEYYANCGVLCHETKKYEQSLEMYLAALSALDEEGKARQAQLENKGVAGGRLQHADNSMFFGFCKTGWQAGRDANSKKKLTVTLSSAHDTMPVQVGDVIRLGSDFETKIEVIHTEEGGEGTKRVLEIADEYDPMDENVEPSSATTDATVAVEVQRENSLLQIKEATTIAFNIARLHEATGRTLAAIELHKAIVKRNPAYVNSYLRLACIAVDCGSLKESSQWLRIAAETAPGNPEVLTLVGNLHLSLADWQPAQKVFDSLLVKKVPNVEAYASLSLGNIYFATLNASPTRYQKHLQYASDYYKRILAKDPANAYAANGLGTVLAEKGQIFKAKEVFNRVREVSGDNIADTFINLGHIYLAQKKHPEALQMYKNYMKRAEDGTTPITSRSRVDDVVDVLLYISFAYFDWARHTELFKNANAAPADGRYKEAMNYLEQAIAKNSKKEVILRYNLCMTKLQAANCVLQKLTRNIPRTVEEVQEALDNLKESLVTVEKISDDKAAGRKINIPSSTLQDFLKHCRANISYAESHLEDEKKRATEAEQERELRRLAAEASAKEEELKKKLKEEEVAKVQEQRDAKAAEKMRKVQELQSGWEREQVKDAEKAAKKKAGKAPRPEDDFVVDEPVPGHGLFEDSDSDNDDNNGNEKAPSTKSDGAENEEGERKKPSTEELFGSSDSEPDDDDDKQQKKAATTPKDSPVKPNADPFADSDDDDEGETPAKKDALEETSPSPAAGASNADLFGDSSDEESDEELVKTDSTAKRSNPDALDNQPKKKRKLVQEELEEEEKEEDNDDE